MQVAKELYLFLDVECGGDTFLRSICCRSANCAVKEDKILYNDRCENLKSHTEIISGMMSVSQKLGKET